MEDVLLRIKEYRKERGFSYENMAFELGTSPTAYRKLETNQTKLSVERLYKIAEILNVELKDLLDIKADKFYKQDIAKDGVGYQDIEHYYAENKEKSEKIEKLYENQIVDKNKIIEEKNKTIEQMQNVIDLLLKERPD